jgi:hypothetical protein
MVAHVQTIVEVMIETAVAKAFRILSAYLAHSIVASTTSRVSSKRWITWSQWPPPNRPRPEQNTSQRTQAIVHKSQTAKLDGIASPNLKRDDQKYQRAISAIETGVGKGVIFQFNPYPWKNPPFAIAWRHAKMW